MTLIDVVERFRRLESMLARERGDFVLFALFRLEELPDSWDLLVSATWLPDDTFAATSYLVDQIKEKLGAKELLNLSRVVVIEPAVEPLQDLLESIEVEHGRVELRDTDIFDQSVKQAVFITSKRRPTPAAV